MAKAKAAPSRDVEPETPVLFRVSSGEITAVFPSEPANRYAITCYAHIGQHGACTLEWYGTTRAAKPDEYASLARELESIGYRLKIYRRMTRGLRDQFAEVLRLRARV